MFRLPLAWGIRSKFVSFALRSSNQSSQRSMATCEIEENQFFILWISAFLTVFAKIWLIVCLKDQNPEASVFGHRSSCLSSKKNKATGMIADNQIYFISSFLFRIVSMNFFSFSELKILYGR
ncbi:hypothetical protein SAMN04488519_105346 [Algoriphagus ornithinivorans]|uniref:Uncharacterized protein n=1 Tax=Algoriphagus ornithinivorans TaxID=226506 RepID=A0A1I5GG28_9BACT|nr:hypothetical protein SAMN04488519_105346 [Algoriphagus ornithinivorans]